MSVPLELNLSSDIYLQLLQQLPRRLSRQLRPEPGPGQLPAGLSLWHCDQGHQDQLFHSDS